MKSKYLARAARLLTLIASPLATAPTAAAAPEHGPLTLVRYETSALGTTDRFMELNNRCVALIVAAEDAAATQACDLAVREARYERSECGASFTACSWRPDAMAAYLNRAILEYRHGELTLAGADIERAYRIAPHDPYVRNAHAVIAAAAPTVIAAAAPPSAGGFARFGPPD
jgi:hypothetical protein